jgi:hypothetical protein
MRMLLRWMEEDGSGLAFECALVESFVCARSFRIIKMGLELCQYAKFLVFSTRVFGYLQGSGRAAANAQKRSGPALRAGCAH